MAEQWQASGPKVVEVGGADEPVRELRVRLVAGRVDVVAHDEDVARVEVGAVRGRPLEITWRSGVLEVSHPQVRWDNLLEMVKGAFRTDDRAEVSIAVPRGVKVELGTVSAEGLLAGTTADASVKTVSGELVVDGVHGEVSARTVSGAIEVRDQHGPLTGESVSGSLTVQAAAMPRLTAKSVSGELAVDLGSSPSEIKVSSVSGDVTVRIPATAGFMLDAKSVSGRLVADGRRLGGDRPGTPRGRLSEGDESVRLSAKTVSGDVTVLRSGEPVAP